MSTLAPVYPQITSPPQALSETIANAALIATQHQSVYAINDNVGFTAGLNLWLIGGMWGGFTYTPSALALTASSTNYIVVAVATGVPSVSTAATNWNDATNYVRAFQLTTSATAITAAVDYRAGPRGVHGGAGSGSSSGSVTSVGLALPSIFSVAGSPVTSAGTLTGTFALQNQNLILAGPASGVAAVPTFRAMVAADLGSIILAIANGGTGTATPGLVAGTNVTITGSWPNQTITSTATGGTGLTDFTDVLSTSAPNATVPVAALKATNAATTVDMALGPKGGGALSVHVADSTSTGGNKRGSYAIDWQSNRGAAAQVASGSWAAIGGGFGNTASGSYAAVPGGKNSVASADSAFAMGDGCTADAAHSRAIGRQSSTHGNVGIECLSSGQLNVLGDSQMSRVVLNGYTTTATALKLQIDATTANSGTQLTMPTYGHWLVEVSLVGVLGAGTDVLSMNLKGLFTRQGGVATCALVGTPTATTLFATSGASTWSASLVANTTSGGPSVSVVGAASTSIFWTASIFITEIGV